MTANTSATGGYLTPGAPPPAPAEDKELDRFLQQIVAAVAVYPDPALVRPRWQATPPNQPPAPDVDWCAIGVRRQSADTYAVVQHDGGDDLAGGTDNLSRHETVETLLSFYGPNAYGFGARFRDGIQIEQNRAAMTAVAMGFLETGDLIRAPELVNDQWNNRVDLSWSVRREIRRSYPVLNLLSASGIIVIDEPEMEIPFSAEPPE